MRKLILLILMAAAGIGGAAAVGVYSAKSPTAAECCGDITCPPMCPRTPR